MLALVSRFLVSDTGTTSQSGGLLSPKSRSGRCKGNRADNQPDAESTSNTRAVDIAALYEDCDWTLRPTTIPEDTADDQPPPLVDGSDSEDCAENEDTQSECSSNDDEDKFQFLSEHYNADRLRSDGESS